jgi:hypothetical protein
MNVAPGRLLAPLPHEGCDPRHLTATIRATNAVRALFVTNHVRQTVLVVHHPRLIAGARCEEVRRYRDAATADYATETRGGWACLPTCHRPGRLTPARRSPIGPRSLDGAMARPQVSGEIQRRAGIVVDPFLASALGRYRPRPGLLLSLRAVSRLRCPPRKPVPTPVGASCSPHNHYPSYGTRLTLAKAMPQTRQNIRGELLQGPVLLAPRKVEDQVAEPELHVERDLLDDFIGIV